MTLDPWSLEQPLDVIAVAVIHLAQLAWWLAVTPTRNVHQLGRFWPPIYWAAVYWFGCLGRWGSREVRTVRQGNDFFEFDPDRGSGGAWVGRLAVSTIRLQVAGEAWLATAAVIVGYGGCLSLLVVGLVWEWLPLVAVVVVWWLWRARTRPAWWE